LTLGERDSSTAHLEEALTAFRAALEERTRERVPLDDWAMTQNNLDNALKTLDDLKTLGRKPPFKEIPGAPGKTMKECAAEWKEMKAANQTSGMKYRDFSKQCTSGEAAPAATTGQTGN
jgi:hypothetical protein